MHKKQNKFPYINLYNRHFKKGLKKISKKNFSMQKHFNLSIKLKESDRVIISLSKEQSRVRSDPDIY